MAEKEFPELYPGWKTVRKLGTGSYGAVYEIQRNLFGTVEKAALKLISIPHSEDAVDELRSSGYDNTSITEHFKGCLTDVAREYALMAEMKGNTNIVYCDDIRIIQQSNGFGWDILIKMELLTPLLRSLGSECSEELVVKLGMDICEALILCKKKNIIHRDIKPQNIFVSENGDYKLGDFGIAKTVEKTMGGTKTGTYNYMAPEIYNNQPYGSGVDIYSLGLVMYWLLNERRMPFLPLPPKTPSFTEHEEARQRRFSGESIPAPKHGSEELKRIVLKACAYDPKERYADAKQMKDALNLLSALSEESEDDVTVAESDTWVKKQTFAEPSFEKAEESDKTVVIPVQKTASELSRQKKEEAVAPAPGKRKRSLIAVACVLMGIIVFCFAFLPGKGSGRTELAAVPTTEATTEATTEDATAHLDVAYTTAEQLLQSGEFDQAITSFEALNGYEDSANRILEAQYAKASKMLADGDYDEAIAAFEALGDYLDSSEQAKAAQLAQLAIDYEAAQALLKEEKYEQAVAVFEALKGYRDSTELAEKARQASEYAAAEALEQSEKTAEAAMAFYTFGEKERSFALWDEVTIQNTISAGVDYTVCLKADGTVIALGSNTHGRCNVSEWKNIISISAGQYHTVGLTSDGTVVAAGDRRYGACDVGTWKNIIAVSAGAAHTVGLKEDGTVVAVGQNAAGECNVDNWRDIIAISAGDGFTVGLKADGTVVAVGSNNEGQCDTKTWQEIQAISAGKSHVIGLKVDGTVVATGSNSDSQCNVSGWKNVAAIDAGGNHTVALRDDGKMLSCGASNYRQRNVTSWNNIVAISAGSRHTVGLKADGTVVAVGKNSNGQCDVAEWKDIKLPAV